MAGQVSPGIVLRERDLTNSTIVTTQSNVAAFVGSFSKGPVGVVTPVSTERELVDTFGKPNASNYEDWFVAATFISYGGQLLVVRVEDALLKNAVNNGTAPLIKDVGDFTANLSAYTWNFAAKTAGTWGNSLVVAYIDGIEAVAGDYDNEVVFTSGPKWNTIAGKPGTSPSASAAGGTDDEMHIAIIDKNGAITGTPNTLLETFLFVSKSVNAKNSEGGSNYYVDVINARSNYVYAAAALTNTGSALSTDYTTHVESIAAADDFTGGVDAYTGSTTNIEAALNKFLDAENISVDFVLMGGSLANQTDTVTKAQKIIEVANTRKDCIAFISPYKNVVATTNSDTQRDNILAFFASVGSSTSYAVFDSGYKYIYDRYNDTYRYIPCCGDVAGLCVQTSANLEDWFSPAGLNRGNLRNVVKLAYTPSKTDRDKLYQKRINPIASFPGQGVVLFGDKTALASPSAFDRINVRRLFLAIEKRVLQVARGVLFELNDEATRSTFFNTVDSYMAEVKGKSGVTDYLVVCDETNNTPDVIDRNEFVAEIYIKPARSINYITITFVATRTGASFAEVTGQV